MAQDATMTTPGGTIVTIGGGFQALQLPDMDFTFKINRQDFGISFGAGKVDDDVTLKVTVNAKK